MKKKLFLVFCFWFFALMIVGHEAQSFSKWPGLRTCGDKFDPPYFRWDSGWYAHIAEKGYSYNSSGQSSVAFWPLYPMTIKAVHMAVREGFGRVSFGLSLLYAFLAMLVIYELLKLDHSEETSFYAVLFFLFWPAAYFLISGYPESLFIFLAALSLLLARKKKWFWAGIASGLLALTKPYGIFIMPVLLAEYFVANGKDWKIFLKKTDFWPLFLPVVSVFSYIFFNYMRFGHPLAFLETEKAWGRSYGNFIISLIYEAREFMYPPTKLLDGSHFQYIIYITSFFFSIWAFYIGWKKVRKTYLIFPALILMAAVTSGTLTSWSRYMMLGFPILIGPAVYFSEKKYLKYAYLVFSFGILLLIANFFVRCYPVE